jgi:hypothetical protein
VFDLPVEAVFSRTEFGPLSTEVYRNAPSTEVYRSDRTTEGSEKPSA